MSKTIQIWSRVNHCTIFIIPFFLFLLIIFMIISGRRTMGEKRDFRSAYFTRTSYFYLKHWKRVSFHLASIPTISIKNILMKCYSKCSHVMCTLLLLIIRTLWTAVIANVLMKAISIESSITDQSSYIEYFETTFSIKYKQI
jgi:hypothetical protein